MSYCGKKGGMTITKWIEWKNRWEKIFKGLKVDVNN